MRQIFVDSRDRVSGTSCDFTIQLPQTLVLEGKHRGRIDHLRVPLTIPTIQTGLNDTLRVQLGTNVYTITLPQQNFDGPGLAAQIQSLLASTAPGSWSCSYNTSSIAMTLSCSNPFSIPVGNPGTYGAYLLGRLMRRPPTVTSFRTCLCMASTSCISVAPISRTWIR